MILLWLILVLIIGGILAWAVARALPRICRWIALVAVLLDLALALSLAVRKLASGPWLDQVNWDWIPQFGIHFHLAMDGLSLLLVLLTLVLGLVAVLASWREIDHALGFYHFNLLCILAGILGVFLSLDLFLFYFSWELMLVPMYFLIAVWGSEGRGRASIKFLLFTQISGLLMLLAILALYIAHFRVTGIYTFEYAELLATPLSPRAAMAMMLGFFAAFAVKLPIFPFHTWLPDACAESPTAVNVILAGLLATTAGYGLIRYLFPLFPAAAHAFTPIAMILAVISILYCAVLALSQTNLARLLAYASISHLGFVMLGIFSANALSLQGAVMTMIAHGISTGALFLVAGALESRTGSRELASMGGLWDTVPRLSGVGLFFALASLGLPGMGDFIGEFLVLLGTFRDSMIFSILAACGVLAATFYALRFVQRAFHGANVRSLHLPDLAMREGMVFGAMIILLLWLGFYPQPVFHTVAQAASHLPALWR